MNYFRKLAIFFLSLDKILQELIDYFKFYFYNDYEKSTFWQNINVSIKESHFSIK